MRHYTNEKNPEMPWIMEWNTTMVPNGTYAINAEVNFGSDDSVTNEPITVTVSNAISFPNYFTRNFETWMWLYAEAEELEVDYEIAMYADETNYIGTFTGSTTNGAISFIWDLTDGGSYEFTNETFSGEYTVVPTVQSFNGPQTAVKATNFWAREGGWSLPGKFVVAYSPVDANPTTTFKVGEMVAGGTGGYLGGVTHTLGNYGLSPYILSPGNSQGNAFQMFDGTTKTNLLTYLSDYSYRNFYYFGHGSPSSFGGAAGTTPRITAVEIRRILNNFPSSGKPVNYHPYRLVFIDGCDVGAGSMCEKFGIPTQTTDNNFFLFSGVRSRAFLGFKESITFNPFKWDFRSLMLGGFFQDWMTANPLHICISNAVEGAHSQGQEAMDPSWIIHGATNLQINTFP